MKFSEQTKGIQIAIVVGVVIAALFLGRMVWSVATGVNGDGVIEEEMVQEDGINSQDVPYVADQGAPEDVAEKVVVAMFTVNLEEDRDPNSALLRGAGSLITPHLKEQMGHHQIGLGTHATEADWNTWREQGIVEFFPDKIETASPGVADKPDRVYRGFSVTVVGKKANGELTYPEQQVVFTTLVKRGDGQWLVDGIS